MLATWLAYAPGLCGGFLFDDFANLPALGATGPIDNWSTFWRYITDGHADPTGRPIALLSFLLDARDWPAAPFPFKRTNLVLHLFNGVLLALLLRQLGRALLCRNAIGGLSTDNLSSNYLHIDIAAVLGASFWLLHPLFISTTLYIVQREAMLPATFTLIGLLLWVRGRDAMLNRRETTGLLLIIGGLGGGTLLAMLSKANGILLPTFALVLEYALLRNTAHWVGSTQQKIHAPNSLKAQAAHGAAPRTHNDARYRRAMFILAWLPSGAIAFYLLQQGWIGLAHGISLVRPWTLGQRLLTEPRVLMDYLALLWLPRPFTPGLFNDQILVSTSLWSPISTVPAMCAVIGLIISSWFLRHRWPTVAAAILFYFVGQSLESSTLPLELYFEHRNYLPAILMFWPLALWLCNAFEHAKEPTDGKRNSLTWQYKTRALAKLALTLLIMLGLGMMTYAGAVLWGNTDDQALLWARLNPESPRALAYAAEIDMKSGNPWRAVVRLQPLLVKYPDQAQIALNLLGAECQMGDVDPDTLAAASTALHITRDPGTLLITWFTRIIDQALKPACPQLNYHEIGVLLESASTNPNLNAVAGRAQDIYYLKGRLALSQGDGETALNDFNQALDLQVRMDAALEQAALLGAFGHSQLGLLHLDHYEAESKDEAQPAFGMPRLHAWVLQQQRYWPLELVRLRATLQRDARPQSSGAR